MSSAVLSGFFALVGVMASAALRSGGSERRMRSQIQAEADLLKALPPDLAGVDQLRQRLEERLSRYLGVPHQVPSWLPRSRGTRWTLSLVGLVVVLAVIREGLLSAADSLGAGGRLFDVIAWVTWFIFGAALPLVVFRTVRRTRLAPGETLPRIYKPLLTYLFEPSVLEAMKAPQVVRDSLEPDGAEYRQP